MEPVTASLLTPESLAELMGGPDIAPPPSGTQTCRDRRTPTTRTSPLPPPWYPQPAPPPPSGARVIPGPAPAPAPALRAEAVPHRCGRVSEARDERGAREQQAEPTAAEARDAAGRGIGRWQGWRC